MSKLLDDLLKLQNPTATLKKKGSLLDQLMALQTATPQPPTQLAPYANIPNPYNQPGGQQNAANIQPTQPVQPVQSTTPISTPTTPDRTNSYQNVYGTSSALQTAKTTGTVLPSTTTPQAINRATPDINQTLPPITPQTSTAQSTPVTTNRTQSPLDVLPAVAGAARASSDYLSLPISMAINATSKQPLSAKSIFDATHEMAKADIASGGTSSIDKAGQLYLKARGIKQGGNTPTIGDIVVLASLGAMNFVDPAIVVPWMASVRELLVWRNAGRIEKTLPEWGKMVGGIKEYGISNDLKIKVIPKENSVVLEGYIRRGAKGELVTPQAEIDNVINGIARQTGQSVIPTVQGNNLVLRIGYKAPVSFTPASNALQLPAGRGIPNIPAVNTPQAAFQIIDPKVQAAVNLTQKRLNTLTTQRTSLVNKGNVSDNRAQLTDLTQQIQEQNQKLTDLQSRVNQTTGPVVTWVDNRFKVSTPPVETPVTTSVAPIERNIKPVLTQQEASALLKDLQKLQSTPVIKTKPFWNDFSVPEKQATITRLESAITSEPNSKFIKEYEQEIKNIQKTLPKESKVVTPKKIQVKPPQVVSNQRYSLSAARVGKSMLYSVIDNKTGNVVKDFATNEMVDAKKKANDLLSFKQSELHVSQAKNQTIAERLAAEKKAFAASTRGSAVTESFISSAPEKPLVYSPTMSDYEKGLYAAQQEKLSKIVKTPVKKIQTVAQKNINNIYKRYSKLIDSEEPDFKKIQELSDKFLKGTGQDISVYDNGVKMTSLNEASTDRFVPENIFDNPNQIYWSRGKGSSALIGKEAMRPGNALDIEIANIEANRTQFNIPKISLDIIRKFGAHLMRNINGTEGHLFGNIIGIDSILNPLGLAHELAHLITREPIYLRRVAGDAKIRIELRRMYMEYYPMAPKDKATVTQDIWIPEGLAEFVRQHLFNPTLISEKYPELSTRILGTGPLSNPALTKMYNELNKMISIYQRLSPLKQSNARITTDINWEKTGLKSIIVGRNGRAYTNGVYSLHPLHILDQMRSDKVASRKINFATDANGVSSELLASMARTQENFGINAFDIEKGNTAYYIDWQGKVQALLNYNLGQFIREVYQSGDMEDANSYFRNVDSQRDRIHLKELQNNFEEVKTQIELAQTKAEFNKFKSEAGRLKKSIARVEGSVKSQQNTPAQQELIIKKNKDRFAVWEEKLTQFFKAHMELKVTDGRVARTAADEMMARPGYAPSFRSILSDINEYVPGMNQRSSVPKELKARHGTKVTPQSYVNIFEIIPKYHVSGLKKHNAQLFYNSIFNKGEGLIQKLGKGTANKPGTYVHTKDGVYTNFQMVDGYVTKAIESVYGPAVQDNWFAKGAHTSASIFQKLTTIWSPWFAFGKNLALDIPTSFLFTQTKYIPFWSQLQRWSKMSVNPRYAAQVKEFEAQYEAAGGNEASYYEISYERNNPLNVVKKISRDVNNYGHTIHWLGQKFNELMSITEKFTRAEEGIRASLQGDVFAEAYEKSRNVSGSFQRHGLESIRFTRYAPYTNAGIALADGYAKVGTDKEKTGRIIAGIIAASTIAFLGIYKLIKAIDDAKTPEEREIAMDNVYRYLDKTAYEKQNYSTLGTHYKVAANPILSAPGTMMGLLMLSQRIPSYKINYGDFAYEMAAGIVPNQMTPELGSSQTVVNSIAGKFYGSIPLANAWLAITGIKTFPAISPIDKQAFIDMNNNENYRPDTNNLAILLGQVTWLPPLNIEAAIKVAAGPVTGYMTDAAGSFLISPEKKAEMGLVDKSLVDLFWKTPMQSATVQSQKTLRGETAGKIYNLSDSITKDINDLTKKANHLLYINGAKTPEELSPADLTKFNDLRNQFAIKKPQLDELKIVKNAMSVMSDFEVRGKSIPLSFKNSLNAYALAISSGNLNNVTQADIDEIHRIAGLKTSINKIDWSAIK